VKKFGRLIITLTPDSCTKPRKDKASEINRTDKIFKNDTKQSAYRVAMSRGKWTVSLMFRDQLLILWILCIRTLHLASHLMMKNSITSSIYKTVAVQVCFTFLNIVRSCIRTTNADAAAIATIHLAHTHGAKPTSNAGRLALNTCHPLTPSLLFNYFMSKHNTQILGQRPYNCTVPEKPHNCWEA